MHSPLTWFACVALAGAAVCAQEPLYKNPNVPFDRRVDDLISRADSEMYEHKKGTPNGRNGAVAESSPCIVAF